MFIVSNAHRSHGAQDAEKATEANHFAGLLSKTK